MHALDRGTEVCGVLAVTGQFRALAGRHDIEHTELRRRNAERAGTFCYAAEVPRCHLTVQPGRLGGGKVVEGTDHAAHEFLSASRPNGRDSGDGFYGGLLVGKVDHVRYTSNA